MAKKYFSAGTVKFYTVTNDGGTFKKGSEITATADGNLNSKSYVKLTLTLDAPAYVGIRVDNAYIDNFTAEHAEVAGTATGISSLTKEQKDDAQWYNLNGQRVGSDYRGIVVRNGVKVLKK